MGKVGGTRGSGDAEDTLVETPLAEEVLCVCGSCVACEKDNLRIRAETAERIIEVLRLEHARDVARVCEEVRRHRERAEAAEAELARLRQ